MADYDVGVEWVNKYHGRAGNLSNNDKNAGGFYNEIRSISKPGYQYKGRFNWGDDAAWDIDFEEPGDDAKWIDDVDIAFFSGHGSSNGPFFGVANHDDGEAKPNEMKLGNKDLEWIVFDACEVLKDEAGNSVGRWAGTFKGLHMMLGFHTTCHDHPNRGKEFAKKLKEGWRIVDAWIYACEVTEGSGTKWAILGADEAWPEYEERQTDTLNDHLHGFGYVSADPKENIYLWYVSGTC
jgi:hypothetical protein